MLLVAVVSDYNSLYISLIIIGLLLIFLGAFLALRSYIEIKIELTAKGEENLEGTLSYMLQILTITGLKTVFLGIAIWAGSILLRLGLESLHSSRSTK